jgi:diguanylate cyclase (GGDEF)-like protein
MMGEFWKLQHDFSDEKPIVSVSSLERCLGDAVQRGALSLEYQPYFDVLTGEGCGAEALARWKLASGKSVAPSLFIPLAERTGKIHTMGAWALNAACDAAHGWCSGSVRPLTLSVNISALQVRTEFISVIALVRQLGVEKRCAIVLRSIITLGADLGLDVSAEGVETEPQLCMLTDLGCPQAQGYLLARPMSARQAHAALKKPWGNRCAPVPPSLTIAADNPKPRALSPLKQVLGRNEELRELIKQAAEELSSATAHRDQELQGGDAGSGVNSAVGKNRGVANKLKDAFERLTTVNQALKTAINERTMVDHQLAAAVEQEVGSRRAALHDHLTGLPNRVLFNDRLEHALAHAQRHGWVLAVMFVDLDNFKNINDTHGHRAGDAVLQTVAKRIAQNTRMDDTVSRYGGDEFLCLLTPLSQKSDFAVIASQILMAIQMPCDVRVGDVVVSLHLDASIGVSVFPKDGISAAALIAQADGAMYSAKENKSGVAFAREKAAPGERVAPYRRIDRGSARCRNAAARFFDDQSSGDNQALPGKSRQAV